MTKKELLNAIDSRAARSAWDKGVKLYAYELAEELEIADDAELIKGENISKEILLNGADDWNQYSWGGSSLIYDYDIAVRLCTPSELKKTRDAERRPNSREEWLDVQARALNQACRIILSIIRFVA